MSNIQKTVGEEICEKKIQILNTDQPKRIAQNQIHLYKKISKDSKGIEPRMTNESQK